MDLEAAPLQAGKGQCLGKSRSVDWRRKRCRPPVSVCLSVCLHSLWKEILLEMEPTLEQLSFTCWAEGFQACCGQSALAPDSRV